MNTGRMEEAPKTVLGGVKVERQYTAQNLLDAYQRAVKRKDELAKATAENDAECARLAPLAKAAAQKALEELDQKRALLTALAAG